MRLILIALLLTASASAQSAPDSTEVGRIIGTVTDADTGELLIGANVWLPDLQRGVATDIVGRYMMLDVPEGTHAVQISYIGFHAVRDSVRVSDGGTTPLPVVLATSHGREVYLCHAPWDYSMIQPGIYSVRAVSYVKQPNVCYPDPEYRYTVSF